MSTPSGHANAESLLSGYARRIIGEQAITTAAGAATSLTPTTSIADAALGTRTQIDAHITNHAANNLHVRRVGSSIKGEVIKQDETYAAPNVDVTDGKLEVYDPAGAQLDCTVNYWAGVE